ncbi:magnesium/cobalt transporter CorA [Denitromonas sp.]|uniref:magnesium/cobalt transporter CorA n=1 Tax=Denitromonas sp. TaxID=2734609 RepID=UPI002AFFEAF7|nr:magnesium/cobalt transporter CorA [Denitromonas sp.]
MKKKRAASRSRKAGLPPGALVHVGELRSAQTTLSSISYNAAECTEQVLSSSQFDAASPGPHDYTWLDIRGLHDTALLSRLGKQFNLHPLILEDILNTEQRAKVEDYGNVLFCVMRLFAWDDASQTLESDQISLVLGRNFVLSFQERSTGVFEPVRERLRAAGTPLRNKSIDHLAHALIDSIVDRYFVVVEHLDAAAAPVEDAVLAHPSPTVLRTINALRHEVQTIRRAITPLREVLMTLSRGESPYFGNDVRPYLRDVLDHTMHIQEGLESLRDVLGGALEIYLSSVSNRLNLEVRILAVLTTLFLPASLIAGIFGMNFQDMPWRDVHDGFWLAISLMAVTATVLATIFWRRKWLNARGE